MRSFAVDTAQNYYACVNWQRGWWWCVVGVMTLAVASAQNPVEELFAAGLELHQQAELTTTSDDARRLLEHAIDQYVAAVDRNPQHYPSLAMWAVAICQLAELEPPGPKREELVERARRRVLAAEESPQSDGRAMIHWTRFLLRRELARGRAPAELAQWVSDCRVALQRVVATTSVPEFRADAQMLLGECLVRLGVWETNAATARVLLNEGLPLLRDARAQRTTDPAVFFITGLGLIQLGQLDNDPMLYVEAVKPLERAVELNPNECLTRFLLARALALCGRPMAAFERLRPCLNRPGALGIWTEIDQLPEFAAMRSLPEYHAASQQVRRQLEQARAAQAMQAGIGLHREAESLTNDVPRAVELLQQALEQYRAAVELAPDRAQPHYLMALASLRLLETARDSAEQERWIRSAREHFDAAARCADAELVVHERRGLFFQQLATHPTTPAEKRAELYWAAREGLDRALQMARFTGERTRVARQLAVVCVMLGEESSSADRRQWYQEAIAHFESTRKSVSADYSVDELNLWGIALLRLGQIQRDSQLVRRAIERFQTALEKSKDRLDVRYNLACSYAALRQPEAAMRHARICLEQDEKGFYRTHILQDLDFDPIRETPAYRELFGPPELQKLIEPRISGR